jgi:hypothetical protein
LKEKSLYYFHKKLKIKKKTKKTFLVVFLGGFFGWVFLGGFFNANPASLGIMFVSHLLFVDLRYSPKYFFCSYNLPLGQKPSKERKTFFVFPVKKRPV